jgi:hypothetical protein
LRNNGGGTENIIRKQLKRGSIKWIIKKMKFTPY